MIRESTSLVFPRNNVGLFTRSRIPRRWRKFFGVTVKYFRLERRYRETFSPEVIPGTGISSEERVHTRHTHTHIHTHTVLGFNNESWIVGVKTHHLSFHCPFLPFHFPSSIIVLCKFADEVTRNRLFLDDMEKVFFFFEPRHVFFRISLRTAKRVCTFGFFYIFFGSSNKFFKGMPYRILIL